MSSEQTIVSLAIEYWKLVRLTQRALEFAPDTQRAGMIAQLRFFNEKLHSILAMEKIECVSFDGRVFEVNMPAVAVNGEDLSPDDEHIVERTLEPAVIVSGQVVISGKVFLRGTRGES